MGLKLKKYIAKSLGGSLTDYCGKDAVFINGRGAYPLPKIRSYKDADKISGIIKSLQAKETEMLAKKWNKYIIHD